MMENNELTVVGGVDINNCASGNCPTIYKDKRGKIFIQGYKIDENLRTTINVADNEAIIELPLELLEQLKSL